MSKICQNLSIDLLKDLEFCSKNLSFLMVKF